MNCQAVNSSWICWMFSWQCPLSLEKPDFSSLKPSVIMLQFRGTFCHETSPSSREATKKIMYFHQHSSYCSLLLKQPVAHWVTALMGVIEIDLKSLLHQAISYSSKEKKKIKKKKKSKQLGRIFWWDKALLSHISLCLPIPLLSFSCQQHRNSNKAQNLICTNQICRGHHITRV